MEASKAVTAAVKEATAAVKEATVVAVAVVTGAREAAEAETMVVVRVEDMEVSILSQHFDQLMLISSRRIPAGRRRRLSARWRSGRPILAARHSTLDRLHSSSRHAKSCESSKCTHRRQVQSPEISWYCHLSF